MKTWLLLPLLIFYSSAIAQQTAYQPFEVDSAAEPQGGVPSLNTFIQANLRKPIAAEAAGIGGRVIVSGIVEPDGSVSDVKVTGHLRPDCDREAVRVFSLFSAWKPAQKEGKAVRQLVTIPITFPRNPPFTYRNGVKISYFDGNNKPLADSTQAVYKQITPLDSSGLPTDDIVLYKRKATAWKKDFRLPLIRKKNTTGDSSTKFIRLIGYQNSNNQWEGQVYSLDNLGRRIHEVTYQNGKQIGLEISYHSKGSVAQKNDDFDDKMVSTSWYPNGQIKQISVESKTKHATIDSIGQVVKLNSPVQVVGFWTSHGQQLVKEGNGVFIDRRVTSSYSDTTKQTQLTEEGLYKNGFKQGIWTVRYADNSYYYADEYDDGFFKKGKALQPGKDTLRYTVLEMMPEFQGGLAGLGKFLNHNLIYPVAAQKAGAAGKVFVSFVVCSDGTLCDYEVVLGVQPDLDREAVRVVKKMSGKWKPAVQRGQKVRLKYYLPINFSLY